MLRRVVGAGKQQVTRPAAESLAQLSDGARVVAQRVEAIPGVATMIEELTRAIALWPAITLAEQDATRDGGVAVMHTMSFASMGTFSFGVNGHEDVLGTASVQFPSQ
jgi:hypothetical protein